MFVVTKYSDLYKKMLRTLVSFKVTGTLKKICALVTAGLFSALLSAFGIFVQSV